MKKLTSAEMKQITGGMTPCMRACLDARRVCMENGSIPFIVCQDDYDSCRLTCEQQ